MVTSDVPAPLVCLQETTLASLTEGMILDTLNRFEHRSRILSRRVLKRVQFFLMRHAFPLDSRERSAFQHGPKVFMNSIPKSGTNLLKRALLLTPHTAPRWSYQLDQNCPNLFEQLSSTKRGQVVTAHEPWSEALSEFLIREGFRTFFIIRDPRDAVVSSAFYIAYKDKNHRLHNYFKKLKSDEARIKASIQGVEADLLPDGMRSRSWLEHIQSYLPWLQDDDCLTVRFEHLIGMEGGGDKGRQLQTIASVIRHLGLDLPEDRIEEIARKTFSTRSRTFRKGQIGDWRNYFNDGLKRFFKESLGSVLVEMGYERDHDW